MSFFCSIHSLFTKILYVFRVKQKTDRAAYMIRFLSGVNAHVALKGLEVAEVCSTDLTGIRFLSGVD